MPTNVRSVRAPRGAQLTARGWQAEGPLRMLMNNLDPEVAERPEELIVYGGTGRAARNWDAFDGIVESLTDLADDETLLVQSGKPVGVFRTHAMAPRVIIANSNLVGRWAELETFERLTRDGLMMFGQMTAGAWFYVASQGIIGGTYETFVEVGRKHYGGSLKGRWILTAGLGGMGGAQPLAATMAEASLLAIERQQERIEQRLTTGYLQHFAPDLETGLAMVRQAAAGGEAISVAVQGNAAEVYPALVERDIRPDVVTDQTSAHDPINGYVPAGWDLERWRAAIETDPAGVAEAAKTSMAEQVRAMLAFHDAGVPVLEYGNNLRQMAKDAGVADAFRYPGFIEAYIRPQFCRGRGQFRFAALSGDAGDIRKIEDRILDVVPDDAALHRWIAMARDHIQFQGLPARVCTLRLSDKVLAAQAINDMVAAGEVSAPVAIGRDDVSSGTAASPNRETEGMKDGSDAVADWPLLAAMLNCASGATWISIQAGGGVGVGYSQHGCVIVVADGTDLTATRLERVFTNDGGAGVMRHADAGYELAREAAKRYGLKLPFLDR